MYEQTVVQLYSGLVKQTRPNVGNLFAEIRKSALALLNYCGICFTYFYKYIGIYFNPVVINPYVVCLNLLDKMPCCPLHCPSLLMF